jgi:hypothetical protein
VRVERIATVNAAWRKFTGWSVIVFWAALVAAVLVRVGSPEPPKLLDGLVGGLIGAIVTLVLALIALRQLFNISLTSKSDFLLRLKRDFFTSETRVLMHLIENDYLDFRDTDKESYFVVKIGPLPADAKSIEEDLLRKTTERPNGKTGYSSFEMDDLVLGQLDDVGMLEDMRVLDPWMVESVFGYYIRLVMTGPAVQDYLKTVRAQNPEAYDHLEEMHHRHRIPWKRRLHRKKD